MSKGTGNDASDFFLRAAYQEGEGLGTWYEYLSKKRVLDKSEAPGSILAAGLPARYGVGIDLAWYCLGGAKLTVLDPRESALTAFAECCDGMHVPAENIERKQSALLPIPFENNAFDLVTNTEVAQDMGDDLREMMVEMMRVTKKDAAIFLPNAYCYAHPRISGLRSLKLSELLKAAADVQCEIESAGYVDICPFPVGLAVGGSNPAGEGPAAPESLPVKCLKKFFLKAIPVFSCLERLWIPPIRQVAGHMVYVILRKGGK